MTNYQCPLEKMLKEWEKACVDNKNYGNKMPYQVQFCDHEWNSLLGYIRKLIGWGGKCTVNTGNEGYHWVTTFDCMTKKSVISVLFCNNSEQTCLVTVDNIQK